MGVRSNIATRLGRFTHWGLQSVLKRNASQLPGRVALTLDPNLMQHLAEKLTWGSIVICGTNGKTTTNNIVASAIEASNNEVLCNRFGANMVPGVVSALLPKKSAYAAVIEADELSTKYILPALGPRYLVLLNLFRDQLDRAGEIDHVQDVIVQALADAPQTTLLVNGDDPLCVAVAKRAAQNGTKVLAFGIEEDLHQVEDRVPEARFCQMCGAELVYDYHAYAQLGAFRCTSCDFARPELDFSAQNVEVGREGVGFDVQSKKQTVHIKAGFGGTYMVYNLLAAFAAASLAGTDAQTFQATVDEYRPQNGRLQHFDVSGREVILNLAKNPTGLNQNLSLLAQDERSKIVYLLVNDNVNDGCDVSWIWDVDFERLGEEKDLTLYCGGTRANDLQVRLKYAGLESALAQSVAEVVGRLSTAAQDKPLYVLANYSALFPVKAELEELGELQ